LHLSDEERAHDIFAPKGVGKRRGMVCEDDDGGKLEVWNAHSSSFLAKESSHARRRTRVWRLAFSYRKLLCVIQTTAITPGVQNRRKAKFQSPGE